MKTIHITLEDARRLPNMLGRICPAMLKIKGVYTCTFNGEPTTYKPSVTPNTISAVNDGCREKEAMR